MKIRLLSNWSLRRILHYLDCCQAIGFVPIAFSRIRNDAAINGDKSPLTNGIFVNMIMRHQPHPLSDEEYKTFLFTYHFDGANWELPIIAKTPEEARARLARFPYATYTGELKFTIPVPSGISSVHRIVHIVRSLLFPSRQ